MKISEFYSHPEILEAFGPGRTKKVITQLRDVWPEFLAEEKQTGFPFFYKPINNYIAAWLLFILCNCKSHSRQDVVKAIFRGRELQCDGKNFIVWFGDLLSDPKNVNRINNIFIFYDGDNCVHVTPNTESGHKTTMIFQGKIPAANIRRAAILDRQFLTEIAELIHEQVLKEDQENWDSQGDGFSLED